MRDTVSNLLMYVATVAVVSSSGALSPGPLTFTNLALGARGGLKSGLLVATGHMLFELPYVILLSFFFTSIQDLLTIPYFRISLSAFLIAFILFFAYLIFRDVRNLSEESLSADKAVNLGGIPLSNPLLAGFLLTALNPYFLLWWGTVGLTLIEGAVAFGSLAGLAIMYVSHVWLDFAWLGLTAFSMRAGTKVVGVKGLKLILAAVGIALVYYAIVSLVNLASYVQILS